MKNNVIEDFATYLLQNHYTAGTTESYCRSLKRLGIDYSIRQPVQLYENIKMRLADSASNVSARTLAITKVAANRYFEMLVGQSITAFKISHRKGTTADQILDEFYEYSVGFKDMSEKTAASEYRHIQAFLKQLDEKAVADYTSITAANVRDYITTELKGLKPSSIGRYIMSLRNFFRFLEFKGISIDPAILTLPMVSANWNGRTIPVTLKQEEEQRLRSYLFADTELGARNRVILLLMLDLGLRCSEIPDILLHDIHWNAGTIVIRNTKNTYSRELPLSEELGKALEVYVLKYRPQISASYLLLNTKPCRNHSCITVGSVRSIIRHLFDSCSISGWWKGTHALRRTAASHIYNSGAGIKLTADILGHESVDSSTHYVKVDFESLRSLCREWPEKEAAE